MLGVISWSWQAKVTYDPVTQKHNLDASMTFPTATGEIPAGTAITEAKSSVDAVRPYKKELLEDMPRTACGGSTTPPDTAPKSSAFVSQSVPEIMEAGQSYSVSVTMTNTGTDTWTDVDLYRLGSQNLQDNVTWGINRVPVPTTVPPGSSVTFNFIMTAPYTAGYYNFQWGNLFAFTDDTASCPRLSFSE